MARGFVARRPTLRHIAMRASRRALGRLIAASSAAGTWSGGGGAGTFRALGVVGARVASSRGIVSDDLEGCRREGRRGFAADASASARAAGASGRGACWSCGSPLTGDDPFFCSACGVILPADLDAGEREPDAFFRLLGVPARFAVDPDALEAAMKRLQKILHPDKFSTRSETERAHSADQASLVNRAYAVLRDPLARAKYMLRGRGAGIGEDEGAGGGASGEGTGLIDPELLMEVMETREAIEEAAEDADPESRRRRLRAIDDEAAEKEASRVAAVADALDGGDATLDAARRATVELTYLARVRAEIKERS